MLLLVRLVRLVRLALLLLLVLLPPLRLSVPLGLSLLSHIGVDRVMWSTDFPHNESTYGYSNKSLAAVVEAVGPEAAAAVVGGNIRNYLGLDD